MTKTQGFKWMLFGGLFLAAFVTGFPSRAAHANENKEGLFVSVVTPSGHPFPQRAMAPKSRRVKVLSHLLENEHLTLNLFPGRASRAIRDRLVDYGEGDFVWVGRIEGEPLSQVTFASRKGVLSGSIDRALPDGNELYELSPTPDGEYLLFQSNESGMPPQAESILAGPDAFPDSPLTEGPIDPGSLVDSVVIQDVMVLYTPAARGAYGKYGIESKILQAVEDANTAYINSDVRVRLQLVHVGEVDYPETGDVGMSLTHLQNPKDGLMDEVHAMRLEFGADLVAIITEEPSYCGIAFVMQNVQIAFAPYAFAAVNSGCLASHTFAHELGHIQGCQHDRQNSGFPGAYPYSHGWRRCVDDGFGFRTVMSYSCDGGPRLPYFSNPDVTLYGFPTGIDHETDPDHSSDNARSLNNTALTVAAFQMTKSIPPAAPSGLAATAVAYNHVDLIWADNATNESRQHVEQSTDQLAWTDVVSLDPNVASYSRSDLAGATTYYFRLRASNWAGKSGYSNIATVTTPPQPVAPVAPANLAASARSSSEIQLTWTDLSANETGFKIERALDGVNFSTIATTRSNATSFLDGARSPGTTYHYRIRAFNAFGHSGYSNPVQATALPLPPAAPSNLAAVAASRSQINLSWSDNSPNESGFRVERSSTGTSGWIQIATLPQNVRTFSDTGLTVNAVYYYRVRSHNAGGSSPYSNTASARTKRSK